MRVSMNGCFATLAAAALILGPAQQSRAGWTLTWLGLLEGDSGSCAYAVSADGSVVVGESTEGEYHSDYQPEAFRWTQAEDMVGLDFLPGHGWSEAHDVSADGSVIVGYSQQEIGEDLRTGGEAFRWTETDGMRGLADPLTHHHSWAYGVSADGSVVVGYNRRIGESDPTAFRWTEAEGMVELGFPADPPGGEYSCAYAVSADGSTVVGFWGGAAPLSGQQPFRWTPSGGMIDLGVSGAAYDVSDDGSLVVGSSNWRAFLWDDAQGMRDLNEMLTASGVDLQGGVLTSAKDVSIDGQTIVLVGEGQAPGGSYQAWMAVIPEPSSFVLLAMGALGLLGMLGWVCRRRQ